MNEATNESKIVALMDIEIIKIEITNYFGICIDVLIEYHDLRIIIREIRMSQPNGDLIIRLPDSFSFTNDRVKELFLEKLKQTFLGSMWIMQNLNMLN
jgi:hypothetical protein